MLKRVILGFVVMAAVASSQWSSAEGNADLLGEVDGEVIWVDFWASWCVPCRRSFPWMNSMHERYAGRGLQIIGVNVDKERQLADEFLAETPARFELRFDPAGNIAESFGVQAMPSSFLLDATGRVLAAHYGFRMEDAAEYEAAIVAALGAAGEGAARNGAAARDGVVARDGVAGLER